MHDAPTTHAGLIARLRDRRDDEAWEEFVEIYQPLIYRLVRRRGFQHADAAELTQDVLVAVLRAVERWDPDPGRGSFRGWLATIARNLMIDFLSRPGRVLASGRTSIHQWLDEQPARPDRGTWRSSESSGFGGPPVESSVFDLELKRRLFAWAAERVQKQVEPRTWQAFWRTAVEDRSIAATADELGMSSGAVYIARSRVLHRLRSEVQQRLQDSNAD